MICPECKKENASGAKACSFCGTILPEPIATPEIERATPPPVAVQPPKVEPPPVNSTATNAESRPTRRWVMPGLVGLVSSSVSGFSGYHFGGRNDRALANELDELRARAHKLELDAKERGATASEEKTQLAAVQGQIAALGQEHAKVQQALKKVQAEGTGLRQQLESERRRAKFGVLEWSGNLRNNSQDILIQDGHVSFGSLRGALPGAACTVMAGEPARVTVTQPPSEANWNRVGFRITGKGQTTVRLFWGIT